MIVDFLSGCRLRKQRSDYEWHGMCRFRQKEQERLYKYTDLLPKASKIIWIVANLSSFKKIFLFDVLLFCIAELYYDKNKTKRYD